CLCNCAPRGRRFHDSGVGRILGFPFYYYLAGFFIILVMEHNNFNKIHGLQAPGCALQCFTLNYGFKSCCCSKCTIICASTPWFAEYTIFMAINPGIVLPQASPPVIFHAAPWLLPPRPIPRADSLHP